MAGKFEIGKATNGSYFFSLKGSNGRNILSSETYSSRSSAEAGIQSVKTNAPLSKRYERKQDRKGHAYFVLKAGNSQVIGKSQMYSSPIRMETGIQSVKTTAPRAKVEDHTRSKAA
jgi:uncharacterized protein YegP (UPF0339 family)